MRRHLAATLRIKEGLLRDLAAALELERGSRAVLPGLPPTPWSLRTDPLLLDANCRDADATPARLLTKSCTARDADHGSHDTKPGGAPTPDEALS